MKKIFIIIICLIFFNCHSQKKCDIDKYLSMERQDLAVMEIAFCLYSLGIGNLNNYQKDIVIINELEMEINNGGFNQYYWNSSGNYANEVVNSLSKIGAYKTAEIVKTANLEFPNGIVPKDRGKRIEILNLIEEKSNKKWNSLDSKFYSQVNENGEFESITDLLIDFIKKNKLKI